MAKRAVKDIQNPYKNLRGIKHGRCGSLINENGIDVPIGVVKYYKGDREYYISGIADNGLNTVELRRFTDNGETERCVTLNPPKPKWMKY